MTFEEWQTVTAPKVQGTWNLEGALGDDLDFFIVCGSFSGIVGQWGQGNYAAANTFLDAFVEYRHSRGRAASVIDIGVMGEVGFVSSNKDVMDMFRRSGMRILKETDLLGSFSLAIQRSRSAAHICKREALHGAYWNPNQIILGFCTSAPITSQNIRVIWKKDVRMSIFHNRDGQENSAANAAEEQDDLSKLLSAAASEPALLEEESASETIAAEVAKTLADFLIRDRDTIKVEQSPEQIGVDSLVAMELRNWIKSKLGVETNVMNIVQSPSLLGLADHLKESLMEKFEEQD
jgi:acyl carrier protein